MMNRGQGIVEEGRGDNRSKELFNLEKKPISKSSFLEAQFKVQVIYSRFFVLFYTAH